MKLCETTKMKSQNLHFIRFLAAITVMLGHSYMIATGTSDGEWLIRLTNNQLSFGTMAVSVFFLCGGYLIARSMERLKTFKAYFKVRIFRLFPALIFVVVLIMVLGGIFTSYPLIEYFTMKDTWKYLLNCVMILVHNLPGVFSNNPYMSTVNGSLWTLPVEFLCYIGCFVLYKMKCLEKRNYLFTVPVVVLGSIVAVYLRSRIPMVGTLLRPCLLFYIGIGYWVYKDEIELKLEYLLLSMLGFVVSIFVGGAGIGMLVFFPYILMTVSFGLKQCPEYLGKLGNYSYGMYLWGFPVQQAIVDRTGSANPYFNFLIAVPITIVLGGITYNVIEKNVVRATNKK